jgi:glutamate-ammonia-ligase adenylyltransferase
VGEHRPDSRLDAVWERTLDEAEARRVLTEEGYEDGGEALALLDSLQDSAVIRAMGERGRKRLNQLVPAVLAAAAREEAAALTLGRVLRVVEAIAKRTAYLALLVENPDALKHLTRLCSASPWITDLVARHPLLLDELIDPRIFSDTPRPEDYGPALDAALADRDADDLEGQMDALREFQQASVMRVAVADIAGQLPVMKVSDHLTWIAEHIVRRVLDLAWAHLARRHGAPACTVDGTRRPASFAVVAYGKLGGLELGYGSDLDLVFLHDSEGEAQHTEGERSIDNAVFFSRLTQRIIHLLSTPTAAGVLYEVDTRLRPSGSAGLLVSSLNAFRDYQRDKAWTWEHQALLRARSVAGTPALCENFEALRREVLATPGDAAALRRAVRAMRERMRRELPRAAEEGFDLKSDPGGLTDVEFLVQYWSLLHAPATPELIRYTDNMRLLESLADHGLIGAAERDSLSAAYLAYRTRIHELTLKGRALVDSDGSLAHLAREVAALWSRTMEGED